MLVSQEAWEHAQAIERTRALLADTAVPAIFEAAFEHDGVRIRVDVLERLPGGRFGLREVKASTEVKAVHVDDCAVQLHVLAGCGLRIGSVELVHVNRAYVRGAGEIDWARLFARSDITRKVASALPSVRERLPRLHAAIRERRRRRSSPPGIASIPTTASSGATARAASPTIGSSTCRGSGSASKRCAAAGIERIVDLPGRAAR